MLCRKFLDSGHERFQCMLMSLIRMSKGCCENNSCIPMILRVLFLITITFPCASDVLPVVVTTLWHKS
jgi:hypothetical protein